MIDPCNGDAFHIGSSSLAAISGYPNITVPAGFASDLPIGLSFMGKPWNEKQLIEIAYAFEQATGARRAPAYSREPGTRRQPMFKAVRISILLFILFFVCRQHLADPGAQHGLE